MRVLIYSMLVVVALVLVGTADAQTAGTQCLVTAASSTKCISDIGHNDQAFYVVGSATSHSSPFTVTSPRASICNAPSSMDGAVIKIHRIVSAATAAGSIVPAAESTSTLNASTTDCFPAIAGRYYLEVTTPTTSGTTYIQVYGRSA